MLTGLNHITLTCTDLDRSLSFYQQLLGLRLHLRWETGAYLTLADVWICLSVDSAAPAQDYTHIAFTVSPDTIGGWRDKLVEGGARIWKDNTSEGDSIYFLDPDGHKLELHAGDLQSRLAAARKSGYVGAQFHD